MIDQEYVATLVIFGKRSAQNLAQLQQRACQLYEYMVLHQGGNLVSTSAPGQHIAYSRPLAVHEEWGAIQLALQQIAGQPAIVRNVYSVFW
jgi:hypothetical protein